MLLLIQQFITRRGLPEKKSAAHSRASRVFQSFGRIAVIAMLAWWICRLLDFPFNLTRGDEGWAFLFVTISAALFQTWVE